jgi:tetratricopeptide (TPR) repeat protein
MRKQKIPALILLMFFLGLLPVTGWGSLEELQEAAALNEQVEQLARAGRYQQALPLAQKALQIRYKDLGPEHPDIAASLTTLGQLYQEMGKFNDAQPLLERALQIRYKALGPANPATAAGLNNLGELYLRQKEYDKALPLLERSLQSREKVLGPNHLDTAASLDSLGALYRAKGENDKALPLYERALKIREKALGPNLAEPAASLNSLGEIYQGIGSYDKALPLYEKALQINERLLGSFHPSTAASLNNLATVYDKLGFYGKAQPLYERALQIRQKALGLEHVATAQSLNNLGVLYYHLKEYDKVLPLYERALAIREKAAGPEHPDTAETLNNLGSLYKDTGSPDKALALYQRALQIREKALGPEHPDTLASVNDLAAFYADTGNPAKAVPLYERLVKGREKIFGPDHLETALSLTKLAQAYQMTGELGKALPLAARSLTIKEKALGPEHPDTIAGITSLAALYADAGAYEKSLPLYERLLQSREKTSGPDKPDIAVILNNQALAYQALGEYDKALALYNRSLNIKETAPEAEQAGTARTLINLASLYQAKGYFDKAQPLYERAVTIREKTAGPDNPDTAAALENLGGLYVAMGLYDKALPLYKRAQKIYEQSKGPDHLDTGTGKQKLATLYYMMGDNDKALPLFEQTAKIFAKTLGADHPDTSRVLVNLGSIQLGKNAPEKAAEYFKQVKSKIALVDLALSRGHPEDAWQLLDDMDTPPASTPVSQVQLNTRKGQALAGMGRLPEAAVALWQAVLGSDKRPLKSWNNQFNLLPREEYLGPYRRLAEVLAKLAHQGVKLPPELQEFGPSAPAAALSMAEAAKSREFLAGLALAPRYPRRSELDPDLRQQEEALQFHLAAQEAQWERAVAGGQEGLKEVINNRKKLNTAYETLVGVLRQTQPLYAALYYPQPAPIKDLPLTDNEVIIEYALGEDVSTIFVVRRDGVQYLYPLPLGRKALATRVREFLEPLLQAKPGEFSASKGRELYELLLAKPLSTISPDDQIIIVPDGILGRLPFETLVTAADSTLKTVDFVGDQRFLTYYPSITVLAQQRGRPEKPAGRPLFALGNVQFTPKKDEPKADQPQEKVTVVKDNEPAADHKKKKPKAPEASVKTSSPGGYLALATNLARGPVTREAANQGILYPPLPESEPQVLDIAKIFEVKGEPPDVLLGRQANKIQLRQADLQTYRYLHFATQAELTDEIQGILEPFLLLGTNRSDASDDGFLTLSEVLDLELGAQMVFLADCHTGRGQGLEGQGVINLARAFLYAGARSVLFNLWDKKPEVTREFLKKFYGYLKAGKSRSEALRLAGTDIRKAYPDPVFWGGYVLYGEGEN